MKNINFGKLPDLVGKTISSISQCTYNTYVGIDFTDGTSLYVQATSDGVHNERWSAVKSVIHLPETESEDELA